MGSPSTWGTVRRKTWSLSTCDAGTPDTLGEGAGTGARSCGLHGSRLEGESHTSPPSPSEAVDRPGPSRDRSRNPPGDPDGCRVHGRGTSRAALSSGDASPRPCRRCPGLVRRGSAGDRGRRRRQSDRAPASGRHGGCVVATTAPVTDRDSFATRARTTRPPASPLRIRRPARTRSGM